MSMAGRGHVSRPRINGEPSVRSATAADVRVGQRLHMARCAARMTQNALAKHLGMSFQQIQKYEKGTSRIAATTLLRISQILNVSLGYFFEDFYTPEPSPGRTDRQLDALRHFAETAEGLELLRAYLAIPDRTARRRMLELMADLSAASGAHPG